ncbi:hypothetical protein ACFLSJ_03630 [Verrucomicrobiota bacterium]
MEEIARNRTRKVEPLVPSWRFDSDGMHGYVVGGREHGVHITSTPDGVPATKPMCLNLEHYCARSCSEGRFVPGKVAPMRTEQVGNSVCLDIEPHGDWALRTTIQYQIRRDRIVEVFLAFAFHQAFKGFEASVSNYFLAPTEPFVAAGGGWRNRPLGENVHRFWARGRAQAANIAAVYPKEAEPDCGIEWQIDDEYFDFPIMITPITGSKYSVIIIADPLQCSSLSANRKWNAHDFSLVGRNVSRGETIACRAWIACRVLDSPDDAFRLYDELVKPL